jgi:endonuclease IV
MLRFGPAGIPASSRTHEEGLERISALGLGALEVEFVRGVRMGYEEAARIGALARKLDIRLSAHAPYYINLNSKDPAIVEKSKKKDRRNHADGRRFGGAHGGGPRRLLFRDGPCLRHAGNDRTRA